MKWEVAAYARGKDEAQMQFDAMTRSACPFWTMCPLNLPNYRNSELYLKCFECIHMYFEQLEKEKK